MLVSPERAFAWVATFVLSTFAVTARAQDSSEVPQKIQIDTETDGVAAEAFPINDSDPESSVPSPERAMKSPLRMGYHVMLLIEKGDNAMKDGNYAKATQYYRALVKATPERARSHSLLCGAYQAAGDTEKAIESCRRALGLSGVTINDNVKYIQLLMGRAGAVAAKDLEDIDATLAHLDTQLAKEPGGPATVEALRCDVATRVEDEKRLMACTDKLKQLAPSDARTFVYGFALNLMRRDYAAAQRLIANAARAGIPKPAIARMQQQLLAIQNPSAAAASRVNWPGLAAGIGILLAALGMYLYGRKRQTGVSAA